jgi:ribosomal protein S18 acetylase RimI-like enzyme
MADGECLQPLPWETRNLGVPAYALSPAFLERPDESALREALARADEAHQGRYFVQARFGHDSATSSMLERRGFYFVEATVWTRARLANNECLRRYATDPGSFLTARHRLQDLRTAVLQRSDAPACEAVRAIAVEAFSADRFHADHNCDAGVAGRRYGNWVGDLLGDTQVEFDVLYLKERPIAFMARKDAQLLLGGFERRYAGAGLGDFFWLHALGRTRAAGLEEARALISLANIPVLNLYARLGFKFRDPGATFHLWRQAEAAPAV